MTFTTSFITKFAWFSIFVAVLHFIGESYFVYLFGQSFIQSSIDLVAIFLMLLGAINSLKNNNSLGILCGAWGFSFCLNFRAWAWRFEANEHKFINNTTDTLTSILLVLLLFSFIAFVISILLNLPKTKIL